MRQSIKRFLKREDGETIKVINRERTGQTDVENDPEISTDEYETDVWHLEYLSEVSTISDVGGRGHTTQAHLYLPGDKDIYFGEEDDKEPSYVELKGERWKVMRVQKQAKGSLKKAFLRSQDVNPSSDRPEFHGDTF